MVFVFFPVPFSFASHEYAYEDKKKTIFLILCINNIELDKESMWNMWNLSDFSSRFVFHSTSHSILFIYSGIPCYSNEVLLFCTRKSQLTEMLIFWNYRICLNDEWNSGKITNHSVQLKWIANLDGGRLSFWRFEFVSRRSIIFINVKTHSISTDFSHCANGSHRFTVSLSVYFFIVSRSIYHKRLTTK